MKKRLTLLVVLLLGIIVLPKTIKAATDYKSLNFREALAEEQIEEKFKKYEENDDQAIIYLFRGKGCGFCRAFLEFMNSITDEYGEYFKIVSYEVWTDANNAILLDEVASFLNQPAEGVPYIVIGDRVFGGYASQYDEEIKTAIKELYDTKKKSRYDVMAEMKKKGTGKNSSSSLNNSSVWVIIICNIVCTVVSALVVMSHFNNKYKELYVKLEENRNSKPISNSKNKK